MPPQCIPSQSNHDGLYCQSCIDSTMNCRLVFASTLIGLALGLAPATDAKTLRLNWRERTPNCCGYPLMSFTIRTATLRTIRSTLRDWAVQAEIANLSGRTISIERPEHYYPPKGGFALFSSTSSCPPSPGPWAPGACSDSEKRASYIRPRLPQKLEPGQRWRGVFGGRAVLVRRKLISISFGVFAPPSGEPFSWLTQHTFRL
jgi:hypothetical protein